MTNIRTAIGSMDLDESLSKRDEINTKVLVAVDQATHPWGIKVTRIEIKDIQPPRDLIDSMARQMKAEREKRANILEAEGFRQAAILKAEGEKQAAMLEAEGSKEAAFREAEARERLAEAEAKATEMVSNAIADGNVQAINYFVAQKYIEAFKAFAEAPNQKFVLMPMEASGVIGSLGGIAELAKEALGNAPAARIAAPGAPRTGALSHALGRLRLGRGRRCCCSPPKRWRRAPSCCGWASPRSVVFVARAAGARHSVAGAGRGVHRAELRVDPGLPAAGSAATNRDSDQPALNRRAAAADRPRGARWSARSSTVAAACRSPMRTGTCTGPELPAGASVRIVGAMA